MKRKKLRNILIVVICALAVIWVAYGFLRFTPMPANTKIRDIEAHEHRIILYLSEDNKLYISGFHDDSITLYDGVGFRWSFLYGLRVWFGDPDVPVLFAENVEQVFESKYNGFLFTDTNKTLYYFGSMSSGEVVRVAENVTNACSVNQDIYYVDIHGDAYHSVLHEDGATKIGSNIAYIYTDGLTLRSVSSSGDVKKIDIRDIDQQVNFDQGDPSLVDARGVDHALYTLTHDHAIMLYRWNEWFLPDEERMSDKITDRAILADMNYDCLCYLDDAGTLVKIEWWHDIESYTIARFDRKDIVDIAVSYSEVYVLFSDGTYIVQPYH